MVNSRQHAVVVDRVIQNRGNEFIFNIVINLRHQRHKYSESYNDQNDGGDIRYCYVLVV